MVFEEFEDIGILEKMHSLIYNESSAKMLLLELLAKQSFVIDLDKYMPLFLIENIATGSRIKPDLLLIHLGNAYPIPNIIPIEIDWNRRELHRHLIKICRCLPLAIDLFPYKIFDNNIIDVKMVIELIKDLRCYGDILLAPVIIKEHQSQNINIILSIYAINPLSNMEKGVKFVEDVLISIIYAIYESKIEESIARQLVPILYALVSKMGIIQRAKARKKEDLRYISLRSYLEILFTDNKGSLREKILNSTYLEFIDIMTTVFKGYNCDSF